MSLAKIVFADSVHVDTTCLTGICEKLGLKNGEAAICAAMEDVATLVRSAFESWKACDLNTVQLTARQIGGIADRIGMVTLSAVARDVAELSEGSDDTALAASISRMMRMGEQSLIAIWEAQDVSV